MRQLFRGLRRAPGFTVAALLTLAIGIGANTAIFSVIEGVLLKPLPYPEPDRLVAIWHSSAKLNMKKFEVSPSSYFTYREENRTFQDIGIWQNGAVTVTQLAQPEQVSTVWVTEGVLPLLGVRPAFGRVFTRADDTPGGPSTVILSYAYWQSRFGGASSAVGRKLIVDGSPREIIGVLPRSFQFLDQQTRLFMPLRLDRAKTTLGNFSHRGLGRLRPGVTIAQANADIGRMVPLWISRFPAPPGFSSKLFEDARIGPNVFELKQNLTGDISDVLWVLMGTIGAVLLIACANVANLLLVRAEGRRQELAIRAALGAHQRQIARGLLGESLSIALMGGVLGLAVAYGAIRLLVAIGPASLPRLDQIAIDARVLMFALVASLVAGLVSGLLPALRFAGTQFGTGLREGGRSLSDSRDRLRARNVLVVVQVALALVLLIGSALMVRTFDALRHVQPGFTNPEEVLTLHVSIPSAVVKEPERVLHMQNDILNNIRDIPGVQSAAFGGNVTMDGSTSGDILYAQDHPLAEGKLPPVRRFRFVAPGLVSTMGNTMVAGRDLTWTDLYEFRLVALVSENLAREYWHDPSAAIGKRIREGMKDEWREVVGVVHDEHDDGVSQAAPAIAYWPVMLKNFWGDDVHIHRGVSFAVRSRRTGTPAFLADVQRAIWSVVPNSPVADVRTLDEIYRKSMARTSFTLVMLAIAGVMALALGVVGIYGVIAYSVSMRRREIGVRMALGAQQSAVSGMFLRYGLAVAGIGVACGLAAAFGLTRLLSSMLYGVSAADLPAYAAASISLVAAALAASYIPARRAAAIDPMETLRAE